MADWFRQHDLHGSETIDHSLIDEKKDKPTNKRNQYLVTRLHLPYLRQNAIFNFYKERYESFYWQSES